MAYNKHEWQNGELITPQLMNNIENGLEEVLGGNLLESLASSYDPSSTYQGGETVTYNNRLYRIIGNEVTGEWDSNNAEEIQLIPLLNRDGEITNNRIESLSTLLTYVMENIAEIYIPSKRHYTGDYVWYLYTLYRFIVDQPESDFHSFDSSEVEVVNVMDIFKEIINNSFGEVYSNTKSYSVGDYVLYKNKIYKCIENTIPGTFEDNFSRFSLTTITNELGNFNQVKTDIERDALTAEAYACGTQNGTAITDNTHPAFENNAKYYSDLISSDAELVEAYSIGKYKGEDITSTDSGEYADAYHNNAKYYYEQIANELELVSALFPEGYENLVSDIGTAFNSTSHTYHIGDYCVHDSKLYRCITEFTATNTWENGNYDSNFIEVNIGDELSIIKNGNSAIINSSITSNIAPEYNSQNTYDIGDYITYNNEFYRCINPITTTNNAWETISNNFIKINIAKELTSLKNITNNSAKEFILANSSYWIVGTLAVADGTPLDNTTMRLRYNGFLNMKGNMISIKTKNNYEFLIYAWNKSDNSYLGCLKTNGQFEKTTGSYLWLKEYNIASQPELKFKIVMRNATNTSAVMTPDDSVNCLCTRLDINNDIITYEFDPTQMWPYKAGEYVRYETQLYRFKVNHVGPWAAGDVERVNVGEELNNISAIAANYIAEPFDSETSYEGGDYITKEGKMYQITENSGLTSCETNVASELSKILNLIGVTTIPFVKEKFINTGANSETGLINTNPSSSSNWQYALVPCQPNNSFTITGTGGNRFHFLWSFMASDFSQIPNYNSGVSAVAENSVVVAPDNAAYLIVNALVDQPALLCRGENIQAKFNNLSSAFLNYKLLQSDDNILELKNGVYRKNTGNTPINWPEVFPDNISSTYGTLISFVAASQYRILIYFPGRQTSSIPLRQVNSCFLKIRSNGAWGDWLSFKIGTGKSVFNVNQEAIGSIFSVSNDYNDGDYVLNNGDLYKFNTSHFSEEWNSEDAEETSITNELSSLNDLINYVFTQTSSAISTEASNRQFFDNNEMMNRTTRDNELMYMMAPEHITNKAYSTGECVIHEGGLYEATTNVQAGTEFSSSNFTETTISSNILGVKATLDSSLSETVNDVDKLRDTDVHILKEQSAIYGNQLNLFNRLDMRIIPGKYIQNDGTYGSYSDAYLSHPILIGPGTYKFNCAPSTFGTHAGIVGVYDAAGNITGVISATVSSSVATFSVDKLTLVCFNLTAYLLKTAVFCEESLWDGSYHSYQRAVKHDLINLTGDVRKEDTTFFTCVRSDNLLDKTQAIDGKYFEVAANGSIGNLSSSSETKSFYVRLDGAGTYATKADSYLFGSDNAKKVCLFDKNKNFIQLVVGTLGTSSDSRGVPLTFTITDAHIANGAVYAGITIDNSYLNSIMLVKASAYPSAYVPYSEKWIIPEQTVEASQIPTVNRSAIDLTDSVAKKDTTFFAEEKSANLLDLSEPYENKYFNNATDTSAAGQLVNDSSNTLVSFYVAMDGAGTYATRVSKSYFGSNAAKICTYDSTKNYLGVVIGTLGTGDSNASLPVVFTVTDDVKYIGLSVNKTYLNRTMVVKASSYPNLQTPYYDRWMIPELFTENISNPLFGKKAIFDGDSICDPNNWGSYPQIICEKNYMSYHNGAVSGGTITSGLYYDGGGARHWVSGNVDALHTAYPDADYIIFEGGTNDADVIGNAMGDTKPAKFGTFTDRDYSGNYDEDTFCGAVETLFYKAVNYWPKKKIGFIIAMKMGEAAYNYYHNRYKYFTTIMDICKKWGIPYINLWDECPMNPNLEVFWDSSKTAAENREAGKLYNDGQHPTPTGYQFLAPKIEAWMKTL